MGRQVPHSNSGLPHKDGTKKETHLSTKKQLCINKKTNAVF